MQLEAILAAAISGLDIDRQAVVVYVLNKSVISVLVFIYIIGVRI